jgi:flagellar basal body rod protein FlgC
VTTAIVPDQPSPTGAPASRAADNIVQQVTGTVAAQQAFDANVATLKASELLSQAAVNIVT